MCTKPNKMFLIGFDDDTGDRLLKFCPPSTKYLTWIEGEYYSKVLKNGETRFYKKCRKHFDEECPYPHDYIEPYVHKHYYHEYIEVPCGNCVQCRLNYAKEWSARLMCEKEYHDSSYFVTFTYDPVSIEHLKQKLDDGSYSYSLNKRDFQLFMKKLRQQYPNDDIRYFMSGEYGDRKGRPHYHAIIFGLHLDDLKPAPRYLQLRNDYSGAKHLKKGDYQLYVSPKLTQIWKYGHVLVGAVTLTSCNYVARYIMKKQKGESAVIYEKNKLLPPFVLMSRRPGLASQYFDDKKDTWFSKYDYIQLSQGKRCYSPRYFNKLLSQYDPFLYQDKYDRAQDRLSNNELLLTTKNVFKDTINRMLDLDFNEKSKILKRDIDMFDD